MIYQLWVRRHGTANWWLHDFFDFESGANTVINALPPGREWRLIEVGGIAHGGAELAAARAV